MISIVCICLESNYMYAYIYACVYIDSVQGLLTRHDLIYDYSTVTGTCTSLLVQCRHKLYFAVIY